MNASPTRSENELKIYDKIKGLKKTDNKTLQKILEFATDINYNFKNTSLESSPHNRRNRRNELQEAGVSYQTFDDTKKYQTVAPEDVDLEGPSDKMMGSRNLSFNNLGDSSAFTKTKFEKMMIHKLAYEWKNIYRNLSTIDFKGKGTIKYLTFDTICQK